MKILIPIFLVCLLLAGCATQPDVAQTQDQSSVESSTMETKDNSTPPSNVDIRIIDGKIDPAELTLTVGEVATVTIHNQMDNEVRIDIPLWKSDVSVTLAAGEYDVVVLTPSAKGLTPIDLNGNRAGTIVVQE